MTTQTQRTMGTPYQAGNERGLVSWLGLPGLAYSMCLHWRSFGVLLGSIWELPRLRSSRLELKSSRLALPRRTKVKCLAVTCDLHLPDEQWASRGFWLGLGLGLGLCVDYLSSTPHHRTRLSFALSSSSNTSACRGADARCQIPFILDYNQGQRERETGRICANICTTPESTRE